MTTKAAPTPEPAPVGSPAPLEGDEKPSRRSAALLSKTGQNTLQDLLGELYEPILADMQRAPKKVAEKVYNALCFVSGRGKLSTFTAISIAKLRACDPVSVKNLSDVYIGEGYSEKTARSQAQQQMAVLPILRLASRAGDKLTLIDGPMLKRVMDADMGLVKPPAPPEKTKKRAKSQMPDPKLVEAVPEVSDEDVLAVAGAEIAAAADKQEAPSPAPTKKPAKKPVPRRLHPRTPPRRSRSKSRQRA